MTNNKAQSQETFAQRSATNEHFAELETFAQRSATNEHFAELGLSVGAATGTTLTDRIANGVDNAIKN